MSRIRNRVLVAMSGGVDSSVVAALLVEQGYDVVGVTMNVWPETTTDQPAREDACCSLSAAEDARRVADLLDVPHYVLNLKEVFARRVIDNFYDEYAHGRTPNPCVRCNQFIKFDALWPKMQALEADYIATGHYARVEHTSAWGDGGPVLRQALDARKDQSYVLYTMGRAHLGHALFPLGEISKDDVRTLAHRYGLAVADKPESQEICFVTHGHYADFVRQNAPQAMQPGALIDEQGAVVGQHQGIGAYTVGQRRGLALARQSREPRYVLSVLPNDNTVVVGPEKALWHDELDADGLILTSVSDVAEGQRVEAKIRYKADKAPATLYRLPGDRVRVRFDRPLKAITPGQSVVFYDGDIVIGGATILRSRLNVDN